MGLDIYTYTKAEHEAQEAHDALWDTDSANNPHGKPYGEWSDDDKKVYWDASNQIPSSQTIKSVQFPDNINERRYLRSSYNAGGFNSYVPMILADDQSSYYWVFEPLGDLDAYLIKVEDAFRVEECRTRAQQLVTRLEAVKDSVVYRSADERAVALRPDLNPTPGQPMTREEALEYFHKERAKTAETPNPWGGAYSNAFGSFWTDDNPLEVVAAIAGKDILGSPCVHLIFKEKFHLSYLESAHVLVEFCDELLDLVKRDGAAYLHWSG